MLISCQQIIQPESNRRYSLWTHLHLYWIHAEPMLKQSSETTTSSLPVLSLCMSLEKFLSSQAFNNTLKIQTTFRSKSSTKRDVLNIQEVNHRPQTENQRIKSGLCIKCVNEIVGNPDCKNKREKLNNKLKWKCQICSQFLCKVHLKSTKYVCEDCFVEDEKTLARNIYCNF